MSINQQVEHHSGLRPTFLPKPLNEDAPQEVACQPTIDEDDVKDVEDMTIFPSEVEELGEQSGPAVRAASDGDEALVRPGIVAPVLHTCRSGRGALFVSKGKATGHRSLESHHDAGVPVISVDYCFLCESGEILFDEGGPDEAPTCKITGAKLQPILVMHDARSRGIYAHSVERKGPNLGACKLMVDELDRMGYKRVVIKSDGEPSLVSLLDTITRAWNGEVIPEKSKRGDSQGNGEIERAIQTLCSQVRSMKIALDTRLGVQLATSTPILSWMIEYAALVIRRHLVGSDGRTAYERLKGRGDRRRVLEFDEHVLYKPLKGSDHPIQTS